jgi:hypothetical protein
VGNSIYIEVPKIFANSREVLRTSFPLLLPLAHALLPCSAPLPLSVSAAHRRARASLVPPPAVVASTRRPSPSTALASPPLASPARATPTRAPPGRHLSVAMFRAHACSSSFPLLPSSTSRPHSIHFPLFFLAAHN